MVEREPGIDHKRLDDAMQQYIQQKDLAGIQVLVAYQGNVVHRQCYGYKHLYRRVPMLDDTIFRMFSMTKSITSLAVMMLWEEGHFGLEEPVSDLLPSFRHLKVYNPDGSPQSLSREITFHDLLTHTSGLGYGLDRLSPVDSMYASANILRMDECLKDKIERLTTLPLHHQPGDKFTYSIGTDVLGHLVELVSGQTLDIFMKERIFGPLNMTDTGFHVTAENRSRLAALYTRLKGFPLMDIRLVPNFLRPIFLRTAWVNKTHKPAFLSGGGGLVSTMDDYFQFVRLLAGRGELNGNRLISETTFQTMISPQLKEHQNPVPGMNLGYGVSVLTDSTKVSLPASKGSIGGSGAAGTDFWIDPVREMIGILMVQHVAYQQVPIALDFAKIALGNSNIEVNHEPA